MYSVSTTSSKSMSCVMRKLSIYSRLNFACGIERLSGQIRALLCEMSQRKDQFFWTETDSDVIGVLRRWPENDILVWKPVDAPDPAFDVVCREMIAEINRISALRLELSQPVIVDVYSNPESTLPDQECSPNPASLSVVRTDAKFAAMARTRWQNQQGKKEDGKTFYARMQLCKGKGLAKSRYDVAIQCDTAHTTELLCNWIEQSFPPAGAAVLVNSIINIDREKPTYTPMMFDIAMCIYLTSAKTYKLMKQLLRWPSVSCLYNHYSESMNRVKSQLTDINQVVESLRQVKTNVDALRSAGTRVATQFTLAIDAFSFRTFQGSPMSPNQKRAPSKDCDVTADGERQSSQEGENRTMTQEFNNGFIMLLIPHDYKLPPQLIHLAISTTGAYNKEIDEKVSLIMKEANDAKLRIWFRATDGDPGVAQSHNDFYQNQLLKHIMNYENLILSVWTWLCHDVQTFIPISDPLHIWKNIRARFISRKIVLFNGSHPTDIEAVRKRLKIGNVLDDESQIGKMRDQYVTALFTFKNVCKLLRAKEYTSACLFLPFACWLAATFSPRIDRELRIFLCELAFQVLRTYYEEFPMLKKAGITQYGRRKQTPSLFSRSHYVKRMLNTLCAFGVTLVFGSDSVRMDGLGTHLVENTIGLARSTCSDPRYVRILTTYAHNEMRKELAARLGLVLHVQGRVNDGGCKVDLDADMKKLMKGNTKSLQTKPQRWTIPYVINLVRSLCSPDVAPAMERDALEFANELESMSFISESQTSNSTPSAAANSGIMARLLNFKIQGKQDPMKGIDWMTTPDDLE